jgi:hypothetical protein
MIVIFKLLHEIRRRERSVVTGSGRNRSRLACYKAVTIEAPREEQSRNSIQSSPAHPAHAGRFSVEAGKEAPGDPLARVRDLGGRELWLYQLPG